MNRLNMVGGASDVITYYPVQRYTRKAQILKRLTGTASTGSSRMWQAKVATANKDTTVHEAG